MVQLRDYEKKIYGASVTSGNSEKEDTNQMKANTANDEIAINSELKEVALPTE